MTFSRVFGTLILCTLPVVHAQDEAKPAEQVYKNITALKGTPADQLVPAMQFIAASLGVECSFCHVQGHFDADDKRAKKTARDMIAMTLMINKDAFKGRQEVSCYSCHNGHEHPAAVPPVLDSDAMPHHEVAAAMNSGTAPTADDTLAKYVSAVGGAHAMKKITSRIETGTISVFGHETPIEVITRAPNQRISITHNANGESITAFDGKIGWMSGGNGHPSREMTPPESAAAGLDAEFYLPLRIKEIFPQVRRGRPEEINGAMCDTLLAASPGHAPVRFYFDQKTGLLAREIRYTDTPVGRMPAQIDYADYRESDGVKIPYRWTLSRPNGRFTIQISDVKNNAPVEASRFAKP